MSDSDAPSPSFGVPPARSDEERAAFFADLMREERQKDRPPVIAGVTIVVVWAVVVNVVLTR